MNPNFVRGLLILDRDTLDTIIANLAQAIEKYINIRRLTDIYQRAISTGRVKIADAITIWKSVTLAYWLHATGLSPLSDYSRPRRTA
jgi:hypothetical protein